MPAVCCRGARVFPTPVGVFLDLLPNDDFGGGLPHARGGVSGRDYVTWLFNASSPRPWGCFPAAPLPKVDDAVFPTPVGVFLLARLASRLPQGLPHARGGVSIVHTPCPTGTQSSPRPWGCFSRFLRSGGYRVVFPTPVGVFLSIDYASIDSP